MRETKQSCSWRQGFTLLELLVVITIISILAGLLVPALREAKTKARMIEEVSAARQLMLGVQMYADDHEGAVLPGYVSDDTAVDDRGQHLTFPANARYPWRLVPYLAGSMRLIYSGPNRSKLDDLQTVSHADYVYSVSLFPSLGINSYFIGGHQTEFPGETANAKFGAGTVLTRIQEARCPSDLMMFTSARSAVTGHDAQGYYHVTPPYLMGRRWASEYSESLSPQQWGFVAPRFKGRAVAAQIDGHAETLDLTQMQDMRRWCNRAASADWALQK